MVIVPMREFVVLFSEIESVIFASLEPLSDDRLIQDASFDAVQSAFDEMDMLFDVFVDETEILVGETDGASTFVPFCVTIMVLLRKPEDSFVNDTVIVPVRFEVLVLAEALTMMVLSLVVTVNQLSLDDVVNVPSVETVTISVSPLELKERLSGETMRYFPLCVISTVFDILLLVPTKVTEPLRSLGVLFSLRLMLINWVPVPEVDDRTIQLSEARAVQASLVVRLTASEYSEELAVIAVLSMSNEYSVPNCVMITSCEALPSVKPVI